MHPIIAFLSFIFSPADDWLLKQAFELMIDPTQIPVAVESYDRIGHAYPSTVTDAEGHTYSADTVADTLWAEILSARGQHREALAVLHRLEKDPEMAPELVDRIRLRIGESSLNQGNLDEARSYFNAILDNPISPRSLDAKIDLLVCDLAANDIDSASRHAEQLIQFLGPDVHLSRGLFPLGLAAFAAERYDDAIKYLTMMEEDSRARYFLGLAYRRTGKPYEALAQWQNLRRPNSDSFWSRLADFQVAETYFALGDDNLSRIACEKALLNKPMSALEQKIQFRMAAIDIRTKHYDQALARLSPLLEHSELSNRVSILAAEAMVKTGQSKDLLRMLAHRKNSTPSAESAYQTAWAASYEKDHQQALAISMEGLERFYNADYTPRLMLLQGLAYEHLGMEAEALATFQTVADYFPDSDLAGLSAHWTLLSYARSGRWRESVTHGSYLWNQLTPEAKKSHPETAFWLAEADLNLKRFDDADSHLSNFLTLAPVDHALIPYAQFQQTVALAQLGRTGEALAMLDQFSQTAKERSQPSWISLAQIQRGHIFFNDRQYAQAIASYRAAERSPKSLYHEALALYRLDYFSDAVDVWSKLAADYPNDPLAESSMFRSARTQFELGLATQAVVAFNQFIKTYPESDYVKEARLQSAHALYNAGDAAGAAPLYADYLARYQTTEDLASITPYLASCYSQTGKSAKDITELLKGLPPTDAVASLQWNEGAKNYNEKKYVEAADIFGSMLSYFPSHENSATALFYRGESLFLEQKWSEAEAALGNYLKIIPPDNQENAPVAMFHRAVALYNQDQLLKAAAVFQAFLERFPEDKMATDALENLYLCHHNLGNWNTAEELKKKYSALVFRSKEKGDKLVNSNTEWGSQ